ncbi:MAG TPA: BNR-4 repeat-containing protein [Pricia sp.]|nr:BNR-4 repeat-containing protein [Pricia sp.]
MIGVYDHATSSDGNTWRDDKKLAGIKEPGTEFSGHYQVSGILGNRIVTFFNRHPNGDVDKRTDLYYLETSDFGKTWQDAAGKQLNVPLSEVDPGRIIDYAAQSRNVYLKDVNFDKFGNPLCLYLTSKSHKPGPEGGDREWKIAQWKNGDWVIRSVTTSDHNYDMGSLYIDGDLWKVVAPIGRGPQLTIWINPKVSYLF